MSAPLLVVTKGNPDDHEIAAATVAVLALLRTTQRTPPEPSRPPG